MSDKGETDDEISETIFMDFIFFFSWGSLKSVTAAAGSCEYLWTGTFICGVGTWDFKAFRSAGDREISDRDYAGSVYSGGGRLD